MATFNVTIPDALITLYNARRVTWNAATSASGARPMPAATVANLQRLVVETMKGMVFNETYRQDPGDGSLVNTDILNIGKL